MLQDRYAVITVLLDLGNGRPCQVVSTGRTAVQQLQQAHLMRMALSSNLSWCYTKQFLNSQMELNPAAGSETLFIVHFESDGSAAF